MGLRLAQNREGSEARGSPGRAGSGGRVGSAAARPEGRVRWRGGLWRESRRSVAQGSLRKDLEQLAGQVTALLAAPMGRSLARVAFAEPSESEVAALATRQVQAPLGAALAIVERARARGEWRSDVSLEVVLAALIGALMHRALLERTPLTPEFVGQVVELVAAGAGQAAHGPKG